MRRQIKQRRVTPGGVGPPVPSSGPVPADGQTDGPAPARPSEVDRVTPIDARDASGTDIERAEERKVGSIEVARRTDPASAAEGIIDPGARDST